MLDVAPIGESRPDAKEWAQLTEDDEHTDAVREAYNNGVRHERDDATNPQQSENDLKQSGDQHAQRDSNNDQMRLAAELGLAQEVRDQRAKMIDTLASGEVIINEELAASAAAAPATIPA